MSSDNNPVSSSPTLLNQDFVENVKSHEDISELRKREDLSYTSLSPTSRSRSYHDGFGQHPYRQNHRHHPHHQQPYQSHRHHNHHRADSGSGSGAMMIGNRRRSLSPGEEESVMIAVRALDDMRSRGGSGRERDSMNVYDGQPQAQAQTQSQIQQHTQAQYSPSSMTISSSQPTPALSVSSNSAATSPSLASAYLPEIVTTTTAASQDFVSRVSGIPLVNSAIRAYAQTKASSRVVKYGAEMMESSMKSISKPVINRLPVSELDEFACRQLDRLELYGRPGWTRGRSRSQERIRSSSETERMSISGERSESPGAGPSTAAVSAPNEEAINRSRWHSLLYEAGGIGAAVSDESMRRLQYCLQWLQYATQHLDGQIVVLRDFIATLPPMRQENEGANTEEELIPPAHLRTLADVKQNVVDITRQVVSVVSKYAGGALPEPARSHVRQFVLTLPERWANANTAAQREAEAQRSEESRASSSSSSMLPTPAVASLSSSRNAQRPTAVAATQAAERILTLATESLDMMRGITGVFRESLDRADTWIARLRTVGIQRRQTEEYRFANDIARENQLPSIQSFGSYPQQPQSPVESTVYDAPSPQALTASSLSALTLSSTYNTPKNSTTSLPDVGWSYDERDRTIGPGLSAVRGTVDHIPASMAMDVE